MLLKEINHPQSQECIYDSSNIIKTIFFSDKNYMVLKFVKEKKNSDPKKPTYIGTTYHIKNITRPIYELFKNDVSQGSYFNKYIAKDKLITVEGKYNLNDTEIRDILEERSEIVRVLKEQKNI